MRIKTSHNENNLPSIKKNKKTKNKGFIRASYAQSAIALPLSLVSISALKVMKKLSKVSNEDSITIKKAVSKGLTDSGLRKTGVKTVYVKEFKSLPKNFKGIARLMTDWLKNTGKSDMKVIDILTNEVTLDKKKSIFKKVFKTKTFDELLDNADMPELKGLIKKVQALPVLLQTKFGVNACYLNNTNKILLPEKSLSLSAFHEMGHAMNNNFSKIGKFLQKNRKTAFWATSLIGLVALTTKKKVSDPPSDKKVQNTKDFVKKNSGKLSFLAFAPVLIEEAMASLKGNKLAKTLLDTKLYKKVKLTNAIAFTTYIMAAVSVGVSIMGAVKVKDNIQAKYEAKSARKLAKNR